MSDGRFWLQRLEQIVARPRAFRRAELRRLRAQFALDIREEWNAAFDAASLYAAWSTVQPMRQLYALNRAELRRILSQRTNWNAVEVGGGNGALWRNFFAPSARGTLTLVDPVDSAHAAVAAALPPGVALHSIVAPVEEAQLPEADVLVCSLMLHHVAGEDAAQRRRYGMRGDGKREILSRFVEALRSRNGIGLLNESDIHTEIDLKPEDPVLVDNLIETYVNRAGMAVAAELVRADISADLRARLQAILLSWCIDQAERAAVAALPERDVYELSAPHWRTLLQDAGARIRGSRFSDPWHIFVQWIFSP